MTRLVLAALLSLAACAERTQIVMMNPQTGAMVGCPAPDMLAGSGAFLVSRACFSACEAHGFRPVPGEQTQGDEDAMPTACLN